MSSRRGSLPSDFTFNHTIHGNGGDNNIEEGPHCNGIDVDQRLPLLGKPLRAKFSKVNTAIQAIQDTDFYFKPDSPIAVQRLILKDCSIADKSHIINLSPHQMNPTTGKASVHYDPTTRDSHEQIHIENHIDSHVVSMTQSYGKFSSDSDNDNEMVHAVDLTFTTSTDSAVRVEIADNGPEDSINLTTHALRKCKSEVLRPYWRLLTFIGWRRFGHESINAGACGWQLINIFYTSCIIILLFYTYAYSMVACQWKLNVKLDTKKMSLPATLTPGEPITTTTASTPWEFLINISATEQHELTYYNQPPPCKVGRTDIHDKPPFNSSKNYNHKQNSACTHIISTYAIPNLLHFIAYLLGFYYFRLQENEQLYALMEKVFLQASPLTGMLSSQKKVIFRLRLYLALSAIWILLTIGENLLFQWAYRFPQLAFFQKTGSVMRKVLLAIQIFGFVLVNSINIAVVVNFITQCEMIIFYVKGIVQRFQERAVELRIAMKDIFMLRQNISALNGPMSKMTTLITLICGGYSIIGCIILSINKNNAPLVWVYRAIFFSLRFVILVIPLMQAARANSICRKIMKLGLEARVFGYKMASQLELDSFLAFVSNAKLRIRIFHIPIRSTHLVIAMIIVCYMFIVLFQINIVGRNI